MAISYFIKNILDSSMKITHFLLDAMADLSLPTETVTAPSYEPTLFKMVATLFGLVALIVATVWILKKLASSPYRQSASQKSIKILEKKGLSPKSSMYLVEVMGRKIVFVESQAEIRKLTEWDTSSRSEESRSNPE